MTTKIQKWGNSFAVRIPKNLVKKLSLKEGSSVIVRNEQEHLIIQRAAPEKKKLAINAWRKFIIPTNRKKESVSTEIDHIIYDTTHR